MLSWAVRLLLSLATLLSAVGAEDTGKRFEFKHSLRGPFPWYTKNRLLGWAVGGSTLVNERVVRLVPSAQNRVGKIWNVEPVQFPDWELRVEFMIYGRKVGADGMGIWYTDSLEGGDKAFGGPSKWKGLGIFVDTFDNDRKGDNPAIYGVLNNGEMMFSHKTDGANQTLAQCQANIRNSLAPVNLLVTYKNRVLEVKYDITRTLNWIPCFSIQNAVLPLGYHFAVTAATGALADDHDLLKFEVYNTSPVKFHVKVDVSAEKQEKLTGEEIKQLEEDFYRQQAALDKGRQEYQQKYAKELQRQEMEDESAVGGTVLDLQDLNEMQARLSMQVEESFSLANSRIEKLVTDFQQRFIEVSRPQPKQENTAFNLLPTIDSLLAQIKALEARLAEAETRLQWEQFAVKEEIKKVVREDIGHLGKSVVADLPWSSIFIYLITGQAVFFVIYLIWKRKVDEEKKFI